LEDITVLSGTPLAELEKLLVPLPRFRAAQIFKWISAGVSSFNQMNNLPLQLREELSTRFALRPNTAEEILHGTDGTVKLVLKFPDNIRIEAVLLTDNPGRKTACLSTQAGCPMGCVFCKTGSMGFIRNLDSSEIVEQFLRLKDMANAADAPESNGHPVSNIVVMGMGEPLLNLTELRRAIEVITCDRGLHFSKRRITVSTCGVAEGIADIADNGPAVRLALSLTTADEALRQRLMPATAGQPLSGVKEALRHFQNRGGGRITLETVLLGNINTRPEDAAAIANFAQGLDAAINLIPWNPVEGLTFEGTPLREPAQAEIQAFTQCLEKAGLNVTRRFRRGRGIAGACGQLGQ
jgi:23S rRNA (adenine2503-C2)-methyltransferase